MDRPVRDWLPTADRDAPWKQAYALVAGIAVAGYPAAAALLQTGAQVTVVDDRETDDAREKATILETLGATVRLGPGTTAATARALADGTERADLMVVSPGWHRDWALPAAADAAGVPILGEVDLAWRLRDPAHRTPWIGITGTNGKTTTTQMLAAILRAGGLRTEAVGNIGVSVIDAVMDPRPYDVLAVELSSTQLAWSSGLELEAAAILNIAPDHLEWHGTMQAYAQAKGRIYDGCERACVYNAAYPQTEELVRAAEVQEGCRAIGFTTEVPGVGMVGIVDGIVADRAFVAARQTSAAELVTVDDLPSQAPHNIANALAAATLARAHGVPPAAVRDGLRGFRIGAHRIERVASVGGVAYVDDSKATNAHAAHASLEAYRPIVWIAGGQAKGQTYDDLVRAARDRLHGVVLMGIDRGVIRDALARHAPDVPVVEVAETDTGAMDRVVAEAARLARPGDTVLLAPGCASRDMYDDYAARGEAFVSAVRRLAPAAQSKDPGSNGREPNEGE